MSCGDIWAGGGEEGRGVSPGYTILRMSYTLSQQRIVAEERWRLIHWGQKSPGPKCSCDLSRQKSSRKVRALKYACTDRTHWPPQSFSLCFRFLCFIYFFSFLFLLCPLISASFLLLKEATEKISEHTVFLPSDLSLFSRFCFFFSSFLLLGSLQPFHSARYPVYALARENVCCFIFH